MSESTPSKADSLLEVRVANMDCESEAAAIARGLKNEPGILGLKTYPKAGKVSITFDPRKTRPETLKDRLHDIGFPAREGFTLPEPAKPWRNPKVITSVAAGVLTLTGWLLGFTASPELVPVLLFWLAIAVGGFYFGREALTDLLFERQIGIELLMSIAAVTAALLGEPLEGAILVFLYSLSEAAEGYTEDRTRSAVRALMNLAPKTARVRRDGYDEEIPAVDVQVGDVFLVKPGESLPTDGEITIGRSSLNEAPVTGESLPVEKTVGDPVFAGTINGEGALEVAATKVFAENTISRIIHLVEEAQENKGTNQRFIERFGRVYSPAVLLGGVLLALIPPLVFGAAWVTWLARATIFIVAAAPCALVISIPITAVAALGTGARRGVLIKGGVFLEELARVKVVALDKTGTLTKGDPEVTDVIGVTDDVNDETILAVAAGIERYSEHPLARAVVTYAQDVGVSANEVRDFQSLPGAGARAVWQGLTVQLGSPALFGTLLSGLPRVEAQVAALQAAAKTVVVLGTEEAVWGLLGIRDALRENAYDVVPALRRAGIEKVVMLTGDNLRTARAIAGEVGIDEVFAELMPEDKVGQVQQLERQSGHVAMVGDGVNDAPALAGATVGIAMGAAGTDVAMETADVVLMADDLDELTFALQHSRRYARVVQQNLALSSAVITALVVGAVGGVFTLPLVVLAHEISEFVVIGNGLKMLRS